MNLYTLVALTRYSDDATSRGRIINGNAGNVLVGHHGGSSGTKVSAIFWVCLLPMSLKEIVIFFA